MLVYAWANIVVCVWSAGYPAGGLQYVNKYAARREKTRGTIQHVHVASSFLSGSFGFSGTNSSCSSTLKAGRYGRR